MVWHAPSLLDAARRTGHGRVRLWLRPDQPAAWAPGVRHPAGQVSMTAPMAEQLAEVLRLQPWCEAAGLWDGQRYDVDLDGFRRLGFPLQAGHIGYWPTLAMPCTPCLTEPWLRLDAEPNGLVLVGRTSRYRHPGLSYGFLARRPEARFVGLREEWEAMRLDCRVPWIETPTILELARLVAGAKLVVCNQSLLLALACGLGVPVVSELCPQCPNAWPLAQGVGCWLQPAFEASCEMLLSKPT